MAQRARERPLKRKHVTSALARAGFLDAPDEARELIAAAAGNPHALHCWLSRRIDGEPLPWLTGATTFSGHRIVVDRGVYVPRPQTELVAQRAVERLPDTGVAVDLATGSGAVAVVLTKARPHARVVGTDISPAACRCARKNGVEVYEGDLGSPLPASLHGACDVVVGVVPYVPTDELVFLPRDVLRHEPRDALDGGRAGMTFLERAVRWAGRLLRPGGGLVLELGGAQDRLLLPILADHGLALVDRLVDDDGDLRGVEATRL